MKNALRGTPPGKRKLDREAYIEQQGGITGHGRTTGPVMYVNIVPSRGIGGGGGFLCNEILEGLIL